MIINPYVYAVSQTGDPFWEDTALLMHFDTGFADVKGRTVTEVGSPSISSTQSKFGGFSGFFNGTTSYLDSTGASQELPANDFTIEAWVWPQSDPVSPAATRTLICIFGAPGSSFHVHLINVSAGVCKLAVDDGLGPKPYGTTNIPIQTWTHIAVTRSANIIRGYVNGIEVLSHAAQSYTTPTTWRIGDFWNISEPSTDSFHGYIDELRITRACRYFGNFALQTAAHPDEGIS